jgi:hypothetical protein
MKTTLRSTLVTAIGVASLLLALPAQADYGTTNFFDNFSSGSDSLWTHATAEVGSSGQAWTVSGGTYELKAPCNGMKLGSTQYGAVGSVPTSVSLVDSVVKADFVNFQAPGAYGAFGIGTRLQNISTTAGLTGYSLVYEPYGNSGAGTINLVWFGGTGLLNNLASQNLTLNPANDYTFTLSAIGSSISGSVLQIGGDTVANLSVTDTTYTTAGYAGTLGLTFTGVATPVDYTIDNFTVLVPEPSSALLVGLGLAGLLALRRRRS